VRGVHWFRNDLRLIDNRALAALQDRVSEWLPVFVLDPRLFTRTGIPRERFLVDCLHRLGRDLAKRGVPFLVRTGKPEAVLPRLLAETGASVLSYNEDTTPFARRRDAAVGRAIDASGVEVVSRVDHVVFGAGEVRTRSGGLYRVYSPYRKAWWARWREVEPMPVTGTRLAPPIPGFESHTEGAESLSLPEQESPLDLPTGGESAARRRLDSFLETRVARYHEDRDRPDRDGTSRLSPYLRLGAISARTCIARALEAGREDPASREGASKWLDEIIWREFYSAILEEHPEVLHRNFRRDFDALVWEEDEEGLEAWCQGRTGYPIVDAGMRQLRSTGWMHNRVRMIVASFLTKDLLLHWRHGERYFFERLVDGDPASNNGGWQWAASTGTDPQPYFRIFNPVSQGQRWDPKGAYVRSWVPELGDVADRFVHEPWKDGGLLASGYPPPIVDHRERRLLALERFKKAREMSAH